MASKVGKLIKEARTNAGLTQEKLAKKVGGGLTAADISKAERVETDVSQAVLRKIAAATGVTQASLLSEAQGVSKTTSKTPKTSKTTASSTLRLTAAEQTLVAYYRKADSNTKKAALKVLKGESGDIVSTLLDAASNLTGKSGNSGGSVADMIGGAIEDLLGGK